MLRFLARRCALLSDLMPFQFPNSLLCTAHLNLSLVLTHTYTKNNRRVFTFTHTHSHSHKIQTHHQWCRLLSLLSMYAHTPHTPHTHIHTRHTYIENNKHVYTCTHTHSHKIQTHTHHTSMVHRLSSTKPATSLLKSPPGSSSQAKETSLSKLWYVCVCV
jgi:hypothetical protein